MQLAKWTAVTFFFYGFYARGGALRLVYINK